MNKFAHIAVSWLVCGAVGACTPQLGGPPVTDLSTRLEVRGASVLPPQGQDWHIGGKNEYQILFGKLPVNPSNESVDPTHTLVALVAFSPIGGVGGHKMDTVRDVQEGLVDPEYAEAQGRFRIIDSKVVSDSTLGEHCFRYSIVKEERDNPRVPNDTLTLTSQGVKCRHPLSPEFGVNVYYSERYKKEQGSYLSDALRQEVESFINSLKFSPVPQGTYALRDSVSYTKEELSDWVIVGDVRDERGKGRTLQYVKKGEDKENWNESWSELVTISQWVRTGDEPAQGDMKGVLERLKADKESQGSAWAHLSLHFSQDCPGLAWQVVDQTEQSLVYEGHLRSCDNLARDAIQIGKVLDGNHDRFWISYTIAARELPPDKRDKWIKWLANSKVTTQ